jgi:hypothetical protein
MLDLVKLPEGARIIDLGGTSYNWELAESPFKITLVNLPGPFTDSYKNDSRFTYVWNDACELGSVFEDNSFDFVFSNSTIEHVGDESRQAAFAREVHRLAPAHWVQTPSDRFPVEAHCLIPFYWNLPRSVRDRLMARWKRKLPAWSEMMSETCVLSRKRMIELFPDSQFFLEYVMGMEKSYAFYKPCVSRGEG